MNVAALATRPHYADHLRPVADALGVPVHGRGATLRPGMPVIVAGHADAHLARRQPLVYMEHGTGQTYRPRHPAYAGGRGRESTVLFLNVNEHVDRLNRAAYPNSDHAVIGCPLLDAWAGYRPNNPEPVVGLAWHWEGAAVAPEARSAFRHYSSVIPRLPFKLLGHGHPRAIGPLSRFYQEHGIEWTADFTEVLRRADVLVFDNTSAGFMFAALDRPVVVLDAPWYRTAWGGRFWEWADVGVNIAYPSLLEWAIEQAIHDAPERREKRHAVSRELYGEVDGHATERAVAAINAAFSQAVAA